MFLNSGDDSVTFRTGHAARVVRSTQPLRHVQWITVFMCEKKETGARAPMYWSHVSQPERRLRDVPHWPHCLCIVRGTQPLCHVQWITEFVWEKKETGPPCIDHMFLNPGGDSVTFRTGTLIVSYALLSLFV